MKIMPEWWHSIRSLVTLLLTVGWIYMFYRFLEIITLPDASKESVVLISGLATTYNAVYLLTLNYYFKDKKRDGENGEQK